MAHKAKFGRNAVVGVISDTHGLMRQEAFNALRNSTLIVHAGDIGNPQVLEWLEAIAPVIAVRGNNDSGPWANALPPERRVDLDGISLYVIHDLKELNTQAAAGCHVVISGHSHQPKITRREGVLYLNPGSAGPRRFRLPTAVAKVRIQSGKISARLIPLLS